MGGNANVSVGELLLTQTMVKSEHLPLVDLGIQSKKSTKSRIFLIATADFQFYNSCPHKFSELSQVVGTSSLSFRCFLCISHLWTFIRRDDHGWERER